MNVPFGFVFLCLPEEEGGRKWRTKGRSVKGKKKARKKRKKKKIEATLQQNDGFRFLSCLPGRGGREVRTSMIGKEENWGKEGGESGSFLAAIPCLISKPSIVERGERERRGVESEGGRGTGKKRERKLLYILTFYSSPMLGGNEKEKD